MTDAGIGEGHIQLRRLGETRMNDGNRGLLTGYHGKNSADGSTLLYLKKNIMNTTIHKYIKVHLHL